MEPETLVAAINAREGTSYRLGERFSGGEQGAYALVDAEGRRFALKWRLGAPVPPFQPAGDVTERLRARGYPLPRFASAGMVDGVAYTVQEVLRGVPMGRLEARYIPYLLELNNLQAGLAPPSSRGWRQMIVQSVLEGFSDYCVIDSLRRYSPATAELLDRLQRLVAANAATALPTGDIVHFDFTPANILVGNGRISGVIDWDSPCAGDRAFDLVTLLFYAVEQPELRAILLPQVRARTSEVAPQLYLAHLIVRQLDLSMRFHPEDVVAYWLRQSQVIARELLQIS